MAVRDTVSRHSQGVDRGDDALLASAYHEDATVDYGFFKGAASEFVPLLCESQRAGPVTLHRSSTPWIALDGGRAASETYVIALAQGQEDSGPVQRLIAGRYLDRHSLRGDQWRIEHRHYVMDTNINRAGATTGSASMLPLANAVSDGGHANRDAGWALLNQVRAWAAASPGASTGGGTTMNTSSDTAQLDGALAKLAAHELLMGYARGVDRADQELLESLFHPDAVVISGVFNGAAQEFAEQITGHVTSNLDRSFHSIANEWVEVHGDRAYGEAYVIAAITADGTDTLVGGRYITGFERREGAWKISSHTYVSDWNMSMPTSFETGGMYAPLDSRGCYGRDDPVYAFWP